MGANLLLAYVPAAKITKSRRSQLHRLVDGLPDRALQNDELESLADEQDLRSFLHSQVDRLPALAGECRDILELQLPHIPFPLLFTGGHSWGDEPSPFFDAFCALGVIPPLYRQLRAWALAEQNSQRRMRRSRRIREA
jgi:hypothetical protein